jgi:hypothetical protein
MFVSGARKPAAANNLNFLKDSVSGVWFIRRTPNQQRKTHMKKTSRLNITALAAACLALVITTDSTKADLHPMNFAPIHANAGVTATLAGTASPGLFVATATGVVQTSLLGTCVENAQLQVQFPATPGQPVVLNGTGTFTSIDGTKSLQFSVTGTANPDPANPNFFNAKYQLTFTGGTGAFASASGVGEINEVVMFTSPTTGTVAWTLNGLVVTPK